MSIVLARVDDRLIHGQVATNWIKVMAPQMVVVVDDKLPDNQLQVNILKMAAPPGVKVYVMQPEKIAVKLLSGALDAYRIMLIFAGVEAPLKLLELGVKIPSINIGGMRFKEGREQLDKTISMTPAEREIAKKIAAMGVELEHRQVNTDSKMDVVPLL